MPIAVQFYDRVWQEETLIEGSSWNLKLWFSCRFSKDSGDSREQFSFLNGQRL
jgi:hypothetical protein